MFLYSSSASEHKEKLHYVLSLLDCQPVSWDSPGVWTVRQKRGGMGQVEFTLPAVARRRQGQKGREDLKGKDVVTCGTDGRKL